MSSKKKKKLSNLMSSVWYEEYNLFIPKGWVFLLFVFCFWGQDKNLFDLIFY